MEDATVIRSKTNALLKRVGSAVAGKERGVVVLEGRRLVDDALAAGWTMEAILFEEGQEQRANELLQAGLPVRLVQPELLGRVSGLRTSPGCLALAEQPSARSLRELNTRDAPRLLVIAGLQDPGNLGALARSAEAAGFDALVIVAGGARPFGSKALRGSMGSLLRLPVVLAESAEQVATHLKESGHRQVCAATRGGTDWRSFNWSAPLAIWVGGESGLEPHVMKDFEGVTISMAGKVESLNITVATSLLLFSAGAN